MLFPGQKKKNYSGQDKPVYDFANTGRRFGQYQLAIWPIPVGDLVNTGWRFRKYQRRYIFQDLGRFEVEIGDSKNMGGLRIMLRYGIKNKIKIDFGYRSVPKGHPEEELCCFRSQADVERNELLPAELDPRRHHDGHAQLHLLLQLYERRVHILVIGSFDYDYLIYIIIIILIIHFLNYYLYHYQEFSYTCLEIRCWFI